MALALYQVLATIAGLLSAASQIAPFVGNPSGTFLLATGVFVLAVATFLKAEGVITKK